MVGRDEQLSLGGLQFVHREPAMAVTTCGDVLEHLDGEVPVPAIRR